MSRSILQLAIFIFGTLFSCSLTAQELINVYGKVFDPSLNEPLPHLMVVSKNRGTGSFGTAKGTFHIRLYSNDTLLVSVPGYKIEAIPLPEGKDSIYLEIPLNRLERTLQGVTIRPEREAEEIKEDLSKLERAPDYKLNTFSEKFSSPITYLYERFSRFEQSKREVARLEYEYQQRELLKELFKIYVSHDVIDLEDDEFDQFVHYLNLPDEFIRNATQYDLVMAVKARYERWSSLNKTYFNR